MAVLASESARTQSNDAQSAETTALESFSRIPGQPPGHWSTFQVQTSVHSRCRPLCACICHRESIQKSPKWMQNIIGTLFLGYCGIPTIGGYFSQKCTETICRRNESAIVDIQYYFPFWFLQRAIIFRSRNSPLYGNQISVKTPRVVGTWTNIFIATQSANLEMVRSLLSQRIASPFDVARKLTCPEQNLFTRN